jgi:hypothetical protein
MPGARWISSVQSETCLVGVGVQVNLRRWSLGRLKPPTMLGTGAGDLTGAVEVSKVSIEALHLGTEIWISPASRNECGRSEGCSRLLQGMVEEELGQSSVGIFIAFASLQSLTIPAQSLHLTSDCSSLSPSPTNEGDAFRTRMALLDPFGVISTHQCHLNMDTLPLSCSWDDELVEIGPGRQTQIKGPPLSRCTCTSSTTLKALILNEGYGN